MKIARLFLLVVSLIVAAVSSAFAVDTTMLGQLVTAAGIPALSTSVSAALVVVGLIPLCFVGYRLYQRLLKRV